MFWVRRLKAEDAGSPWELSYADLMSLLMAVFVLIATMSELRPTVRFNTVSGAVRSAFGFGGVPELSLGGAAPPNLLERLRQAGFERARRTDRDEAVLDICDVATEGNRLVIRIAGPATFDRFSARLKPKAERAIELVGGYLEGGQAQLEIRGHAGDGAIPKTAALRDGLDLSYQRAHAAAEVLRRAGVDSERIRITAWGDNDPLVAGGAEAEPEGANRRLEIVVHAVMATPIADGGQRGHG